MKVFTATVLSLVATLLLVWGGTSIAIGVLFGLSKLDSPSLRDAKRHWSRGEQLEEAGKVEEALAEYRRAMADGEMPWGTRHVADLLEQLGRFEEALVEIDRNRNRMSGGDYCDLRTDCLQQWKGTQAAVDWLEEMDRDDPTRPWYQKQLGSFHFYDGRAREAIEPLLEAERRALRRLRLEWTVDDRLVPEPGTPPHRSNNDLCDLWPTLETVAEAYERADDPIGAVQYAHRAISLHQWLNRLKGYYSAEQCEAGSFEGRMVLVRRHLRTGDVEAAARELRLASAIVSQYTPHQRELSDAKRALQRLKNGSPDGAVDR